MEFRDYNELKTFVKNANNKCNTPQEFENWCNENAYKHSVNNELDLLGEPILYDATELALCI